MPSLRGVVSLRRRAAPRPQTPMDRDRISRRVSPAPRHPTVAMASVSSVAPQPHRRSLTGGSCLNTVPPGWGGTRPASPSQRRRGDHWRRYAPSSPASCTRPATGILTRARSRRPRACGCGGAARRAATSGRHAHAAAREGRDARAVAPVSAPSGCVTGLSGLCVGLIAGALAGAGALQRVIAVLFGLSGPLALARCLPCVRGRCALPPARASTCRLAKGRLTHLHKIFMPASGFCT